MMAGLNSQFYLFEGLGINSHYPASQKFDTLKIRQVSNLLDSAMDAIAFAAKPVALIVSEPGSVATVLTTGTAKPVVPAKPTKVVRAADVALQSYLETESEVDEYLARLKNKIIAEINAGGKVRVQ